MGVHAFGVCFFQLFANGKKCFTGGNDDAIKDATLNTPPKLDVIGAEWHKHGELLALLGAMLSKTPQGRPSAEECLGHPFLSDTASGESGAGPAVNVVPDA